MMFRKRSSRWDWFSVVWFVVGVGTIVFDELSLWTMGAVILSTVSEATAEILRYLERRFDAELP